MTKHTDFFKAIHSGKGVHSIHSCQELIECIEAVGFLPLLESGIAGFAAESMMAEECRYRLYDDGSWEWPLWQWKGSVIKETGCAYGKFFAGKAGFISRNWWPDFCNYRRSVHPAPDGDSIEGMILAILREEGSMVTRDLRAACDFRGKNMRSKFDAYVGRLQMGCHIVTEDFVYPTDKKGRQYGFGWSLLTTPEQLMGRETCHCKRSPKASFERIFNHLHSILPTASEQQLMKMLR